MFHVGRLKLAVKYKYLKGFVFFLNKIICFPSKKKKKFWKTLKSPIWRKNYLKEIYFSIIKINLF